MSAIGGPIESISIAGREFKVTADADGNRKLGGFENEYASNGDGSARLLKTRVPWMLTGITVECDDAIQDHEFLAGVQKSAADVDITVTFISGAIYAGAGNITGELGSSSASASAELELSGPGELKRI